MKGQELIGAPSSRWPALDYASWKPTYETLRRWVQIVGKIRLSKSPWLNHGWNCTLYVSEAGLTTSVIHDGDVSFSIELDFADHLLRVRCNQRKEATFELRSMTVASFYARLKGAIQDLGIGFSIYEFPNELSDSTPFSKDELHHQYEPEQAQTLWRILLSVDQVMKDFRTRFVGKSSPVHFFWGAFDLAVTRFSGRRAPQHPGGLPHLPDLVTREAYSHEVSSCGFWPGNELFPQPGFYSYAYPAPPEFERASLPKGAFFHPELREFILPYDEVRSSSSPENLLLEFFQRTYEAAAELAHWDRDALEHSGFLEQLQASRAKIQVPPARKSA